jgi:hypothetical protein
MKHFVVILSWKIKYELLVQHRSYSATMGDEEMSVKVTVLMIQKMQI